MVSPALSQNVAKDTPTGSPGTNQSESAASTVPIPLLHTLCRCQPLGVWAKECGRGHVGEEPGRQKAPPAPTPLPVSSGRAESPAVHTLRPGRCHVHLQLTLQSKPFCSLKPEKHVELNKERSLCFCVWPSGCLGADRLNGSSSHGSRES